MTCSSMTHCHRGTLHWSYHLMLTPLITTLTITLVSTYSHSLPCNSGSPLFFAMFPMSWWCKNNLSNYKNLWACKQESLYNDILRGTDHAASAGLRSNETNCSRWLEPVFPKVSNSSISVGSLQTTIIGWIQLSRYAFAFKAYYRVFKQ